MKSRPQVVKAWAAGKAAHSSSMWTDGQTLYSYNLPIGITVNGRKILFNFSKSGGLFISITTSIHVSIARSEADEVVDITPKLKKWLQDISLPWKHFIHQPENVKKILLHYYKKATKNRYEYIKEAKHERKV